MISPNIYDYVKSEEAKFETEDIQVGDNWYWNFKKHIQMIFHLKNGVFFTGENNWLRAFKNIFEPILELSYWTEDIEMKEVVIYTEDEDNRAVSFLAKKYHDEVFSKKHNLDEMLDEITESDLDYGGVLVQDGVERPEVIQLNSIAFCDQTDILGGPIGFKFYFTPDKLMSMSKFGWGDEKNGATISLYDLCVLASSEKEANTTVGSKKNQTTGKTIELFVVRGNLPDHYMSDNNDMENWYNQIQIIAFYTNKKSEKVGVTLYRKKEDEGSLKFFTSKKVYQRALGRGVGERLIHPQIWTNFLTIHKTALLEAGSKVPLFTDDSSYMTKNRIQDMENLEITTIEKGSRIGQIPTVAPTNIQLYANSIDEWYRHSQLVGSANDPIMGVEQASGTTFRGQERVVAQGRGPHDKRKGQRAKFIEEIYQDMILPRIEKEMRKGKKFLASLSLDELNWVADRVSENMVDKKIIEMMLDGKAVFKEDRDSMIAQVKQTLLKKGNKHLFELIGDELKDLNLKVRVNVANKNKNLAGLSDKILSIFQFIFANPQAFQQAMSSPALSKAFEDILEYSNINQTDFATLLNTPVQSPIQQEQLQTTKNPQLELQNNG